VTFDAQMSAEDSSNPVIIVAPLGQDASAMAALLNAAYVQTSIHDNLRGCVADIRTDTAALLLTEECLHLELIPDLLQALRAQPKWSELPLIVLTRGGEDRRMALVELIAAAPGTVTVLERPMQSSTLLHTVHVALRSRQRQYQVRDLLAEKASLLEAERSARNEVERTSQLKDEFLATLSHELRTPLTAILGWAQLLKRGKMAVTEVAEGIAVIERNAKAQTQLIADLLDMSRIISGKVRLDLQPVALQELMDSAVSSIRPAAVAKGVLLQVNMEPFADVIRGDPNRLQQCVWNLLSNALKFTPDGGKIHVSVARAGSHLEITVADTGEGIKAEFLPHIFERFRQADASITRRHGGLGLGLSIVKQLVELHGGTVRATSPGEGLGSTFAIELPVAVVQRPERSDSREYSQPLHPATTPADRPSLAGLRVLVVDDEADGRELVRRVLEDCGAQVLLASSAYEGLSIVERDRLDMIVSDIGMPHTDGYEFITRVRQLDSDNGRVPAAALTAFARTEDRDRALRAGYQIHMIKPVEPTELTATVAKLARPHRP